MINFRQRKCHEGGWVDPRISLEPRDVKVQWDKSVTRGSGVLASFSPLFLNEWVSFFISYGKFILYNIFYLYKITIYLKIEEKMKQVRSCLPMTLSPHFTLIKFCSPSLPEMETGSSKPITKMRNDGNIFIPQLSL